MQVNKQLQMFNLVIVYLYLSSDILFYKRNKKLK